MTRSEMASNRAFTVGHNWYGDDWRVDEAGCLHTGTATPFVERTVTTHNGTQ